MNDLAIEVRLAARGDLVDHFDWLAREAGETTAQRMLDNAQAEFIKLGATPGLGSPVETGRPDLRGLRKWRVPGFPKLLIFYQPAPDYLYIVRVFHSAQDWLVELQLG